LKDVLLGPLRREVRPLRGHDDFAAFIRRSQAKRPTPAKPASASDVKGRSLRAIWHGRGRTWLGWFAELHDVT
jgi:hypothetical protein